MKPSEFYRERRPEYFSDTETIIQQNIPREVLAYELSKISTNQKQDEFETLCRRLSEKYITPNLIPQVGPTGGGDGKTDYETHPVAESISDRWFIPENGWEKDEKWAFAISAKEDWKPKVKSDVKKIVNTGRDYTKVFFITNQLISSKKKKDTQDDLVKEYSVEVVILDAEWILEKIYNNKDFNLVVDSLNLSNTYRTDNISNGPNDSFRKRKLLEIEANLKNTNRYFEYDYQLFEDALEAASLSRMLEMGRDEIEGKYDRVLRLCKKIDVKKYYIKYHYQRAWTYLYWFDDYKLFIEQYLELKKCITKDSTIDEIEKYFNLVNSLVGIVVMDRVDPDEYGIDINVERTDIIKLLKEIETNQERVNSSLIAETYKNLLLLNKCIFEKSNPNTYISELISIISRSEGLIDYPFDSFKEILEVLGQVIIDSPIYDELIDLIASISEKRNSELSAGELFVRRGGQKLQGNLYKDSIIYFGKAVLKLAKEETQYGLCLSLLGLGMSYSNIGLHWAAYNSFISACSLSFKSISDDGVLKEKTFQCLLEIVKNELITGRLPHFFSWYEMLLILSHAYNRDLEEYDINDIPFTQFIDSCLSVRLINTRNIKEDYIGFLPEILQKFDLQISYITCLYMLGYIDEIDKKKIGLEEDKDLDDFFFKVFSQPFKEQMAYETNPIYKNNVQFQTLILGCKISVECSNKLDLLLFIETFLSYIESFLSTSLSELMAHTEEIHMEFVESNSEESFAFQRKEYSNKYTIFINSLFDDVEDKKKQSENLFKLTASIISNHFIGKDLLNTINELYEKEEVNERVSLIHNHRIFVTNLLGDNPKLFLENWFDAILGDTRVSKREKSTLFVPERNIKRKEWDFDIGKVRHDEVETHSIINVPLWDNAKWSGFGVLYHPSIGLGITISFSEIKYGIKIFDEWKEKFGDSDKLNNIKITIIKGVNRDNPYWYRVHIGSNINITEQENPKKLFFMTSRIHEMHATNDSNLKLIEDMFLKHGKYSLFPASMKDGDHNMEPIMEKGIRKTKINFRDAWEIGLNDIDSVVIHADDKPFIPKDIENAPIVELLEEKKLKK